MHLIHDLRLVLLSIAACLEARGRHHASAASDAVHALRLLDIGIDITDELLLSSCARTPVSFIDVNTVVEDLDAAISAIVGPAVVVNTKVGALDSRVHAQRIDIERIVLNLVLNAAAAMPSGGVLTIETESDLDGRRPAPDSIPSFGTVRIRIRDSGRGMSDAQLERAINPTASPRPDGSGLGLASVALILTRLSGTLAIDCDDPPGTLVTVTLPLSTQASTRIH